MTAVVALGGSALVRAGEQGTAGEEATNLRRTAASLADALSGRAGTTARSPS